LLPERLQRRQDRGRVVRMAGKGVIASGRSEVWRERRPVPRCERRFQSVDIAILGGPALTASAALDKAASGLAGPAQTGWPPPRDGGAVADGRSAWPGVGRGEFVVDGVGEGEGEGVCDSAAFASEQAARRAASRVAVAIPRIRRPSVESIV
jgi:hypothetical protein